MRSPHKIPTIQKTVKTMPTSDGGQSMKRKKLLEPTIGLEPMTCRLRIDCSTN